jgi:uncharacterized membrane protein YkoI
MKIISIRSVSSAFVLLTASAFAHADGKLPAQQVIAAIQTAVATFPGQIKEVEVEQERGQRIVEVRIENDKGNDETIKVDPEKNQVIK